MKNGLAIAILLIWFYPVARSQSVELNFSGNYGLPQYDSFFDVGFEGRPGVTVRYRHLREDRFRVGLLAEYQRFTRLIDSPIDLDDARLFSFCFVGGYDLLPNIRDRFEPVLEAGFHYFRYNGGAFTGSGFGLNIGLQYCYMVEKEYGVEIGIVLKNVFARFGAEANPNNTGLTQIIQIRLGASIELLRQL